MSTKTKFHFSKEHTENPVDYDVVKLYNIGDCCAVKGYKIEEHKQEFFEVCYIMSGNATFVCNGESYRVKRGDLFIVKKGDTHSIVTSDSNPVRYFYFSFGFNSESKNYEEFKDLETFFINNKKPIRNDKFFMQDLFFNTLNEFRQDFSKKELVITSCLKQLVIYTFKSFEYSDKYSYNEHFNSREAIVYDIAQYIERNIENIKSLTDVSDYIGFSYSYTQQMFSSIMKISLGSYYQKMRFEKAIELMGKNIRITQIAEILNFDSVNSFGRSFKKHTGLSPKEYMKKIGENNNEN